MVSNVTNFQCDLCLSLALLLFRNRCCMKMPRTACLADSDSSVDTCWRLAPLQIHCIVGIAGELLTVYLIHGMLSEIAHVSRVVFFAVSLGIKSVALAS